MLLINTLRYKAWADARSLNAAARLDTRCFAQQDAFIRQQFNHMVRVEEVFRARLLAQPDPHSSTNSEAVPPMHDLHERLTASNHWLQAYAPSLTPDSLGKTLHLRFLDGQAGSLCRIAALSLLFQSTFFTLIFDPNAPI